VTIRQEKEGHKRRGDEGDQGHKDDQFF